MTARQTRALSSLSTRGKTETISGYCTHSGAMKQLRPTVPVTSSLTVVSRSAVLTLTTTYFQLSLSAICETAGPPAANGGGNPPEGHEMKETSVSTYASGQCSLSRQRALCAEQSVNPGDRNRDGAPVPRWHTGGIASVLRQDATALLVRLSGPYLSGHLQIQPTSSASTI